MYKRIAEWIIPLSCIFFQYRAIVSSYGLLAIMMMLILFFMHYRYFQIDKRFLCLGFIIAIQQLIAAAILNRSLNAVTVNVVNMFMSIFATSLVMYKLNVENIIRNYKIIGLISAIAVCFQTIGYVVFGIPVKAIMILPQSAEVMHYWTLSNVRACGFFTEPQTYCTYILPLLIICMDRREYKFSAFLSLSILLTGSSLGIAMMALLWLELLMKSEVERNKKIIIIGFLAIVLVLFSTLDVFESARNKIATVFDDYSLYTSLKMTNSHSYTNYLRLVKGWATLFELPTREKIIGLTLNGMVAYLSGTSHLFSWSKQWSVESSMAGYFSSAAGVFIECGVIVGAIYYFFVGRMIVKNTGIARTLLVFLILQSIMTQFFFNGCFTFYMMMFYLFRDDRDKVLTFKIGS